MRGRERAKERKRERDEEKEGRERERERDLYRIHSPRRLLSTLSVVTLTSHVLVQATLLASLVSLTADKLIACGSLIAASDPTPPSSTVSH